MWLMQQRGRGDNNRSVAKEREAVDKRDKIQEHGVMSIEIKLNLRKPARYPPLVRIQDK